MRLSFSPDTLSNPPMRTAYFDCIAGASGDMMLGALVDAGLPGDQLEAERRHEALQLRLLDGSLAAAALDGDVRPRARAGSAPRGDPRAAASASSAGGERREAS